MHTFELFGPVLKIIKLLSKLKFTRQNAAQRIRQNKIFRGCMPPPPPSQTSRLRFCNKCTGQILGLDTALMVCLHTVTLLLREASGLLNCIMGHPNCTSARFILLVLLELYQPFQDYINCSNYFKCTIWQFASQKQKTKTLFTSHNF